MTQESAIADDLPASESHSCPHPDQCECRPAMREARSLTEMSVGSEGIVCETCLDPRDAAMLRAMGLRPRSRVRVCRLGDPCIVEVMPNTPGGCGCRIGLARPLAARVMIGIA